MKKVDSLIRIPTGNNCELFTNTLTGAIDILNSETVSAFENYDLQKNNADSETIRLLMERGYLIEGSRESMLRDKLIKKLLIRHEEKIISTDSATIIITYNCNFQCEYCYEDLTTKGLEWKNKVISTELVDAIYETSHRSAKHIRLFGGEPLLLENRNIVEYILEKFAECEFSITTNGYYLEDFLPKLCLYKINEIEVTLDGFEKKHNERRYTDEGGSYKKILSGVAKALEKGFKVSIRMNVDSSNIEESYNLSKVLLEKFSCYKEQLAFFRNPVFGNEKICRSQLFQMILDQTIHKNELDLSIESLNTIVPVLLGKAGAIWTPKFEFCNANTTKRIYDPHGYVYSCPISVGIPGHALGRYYPNFQPINNWLDRTIKTIDKCKDCNKALLCGGGCGYEPLKNFGDLNLPNCGNTNLLVNTVIPAIISDSGVEG